MRNVFKGKNLTHLLYGILMLLPFCSILARVIYVQSNQNAKDSYYGETINEKTKMYLNSNSELLNYNSHTYFYDNNLTLANTRSGSIFLTDLSMVVSSMNSTQLETYNSIENQVRRIYVYQGTSVTFYDENDTTLMVFAGTGIQFIATFNFVSSSSTFIYQCFYYWEYNDYSYMDNVFDYSLHNFIEDNNYNVDFFGWFNNLFLNQSGKNLLYLNFVNWYLNYALLVSAGYILFLLFLWFINFARKLLEGGNSFGHGGF